MGRPSTYSPEVVEAICERLSAGEPLAAICREEGMPAARTVRAWEAERPEVATAIAGAREEGEDILAAECLTIADSTDDKPECRKVRVWTRLQLLAKFNPKRWGDKTQAEVTLKHASAELGDDELAAIATSRGS